MLSHLEVGTLIRNRRLYLLVTLAMLVVSTRLALSSAGAYLESVPPGASLAKVGLVLILLCLPSIIGLAIVAEYIDKAGQYRREYLAYDWASRTRRIIRIGLAVMTLISLASWLIWR